MNYSLSFFLILVISVLTSCDLMHKDKLYNNSIDEYKKGNVESAIALLDRVIKKDSKYRPAIFNRAVYKTNIQDIEGAKNDYKLLLEFDSDNTESLYNLGLLYAKQDSIASAIHFYNLALATSTIINCDYSGHKIIFNTNLELNLNGPKWDNDSEYSQYDCDILFSRAEAFFEIKQFDKAIVDFKKYLKTGYDEEVINFYLGNAYLGKRDSAMACQYFIISAKLGMKEARQKIKDHCLWLSSKKPF